MGRRGDAFADIFYGAYWDTHTNIALNPHIGTGSSSLNVQVIFVSSLFMEFILLLYCFGEPLGDVTL